MACRAERQIEEEAVATLLTLLGNEAADFDFGEYNEGEATILQPAMARRGYTSVSL